ncbi:unnamed protein product [Rotaria socialis]
MMALYWIKKNIAGFDGNPEQITVGGENAGGISITILLTSSLVANEYRFICKCVWNIWFASYRRLRLNDIMENYYARGNFQKVPILIETTANETTTVICQIFNGTANSVQVQAYFKILYNTTIIDEILKIDGPISALNNPLTYLNIVFSDSWMHCGSRRIASTFSSYGLPSYLYTYNHVLTVTPSCLGATHAAELSMFFPSYLRYFLRNYTFTALDQQLSTNMMLYWANVIYNSNPNYSRNSTNWDVYHNVIDNDFFLEINSQMRNHYYNPTCSRFWGRFGKGSECIEHDEILPIDAAKHFGIPTSTIYNRLSGRFTDSGRGVRTILSKEEETFLVHVIILFKNGNNL